MFRYGKALLCAVLILALSAVCAVPALAACDAHVPDAGTVTLEPTCDTIGLITYACQVCGEHYDQKLGNLGHSYAEGVCIRCGAADESYVPPAAEPETPARAPAVRTRTAEAAPQTLLTVSPRTTDADLTLFWGVLMLGAMAGLLALCRRAHH